MHYSLVMNVSAACELTPREVERLQARLEYTARCLPRIVSAEVTDFEEEESEIIADRR